MRKLHDIIRRCKDEYNFYLFWVEHNIFLAMPLEIKYNGFKRNDAMIRKKTNVYYGRGMEQRI